MVFAADLAIVAVVGDISTEARTTLSGWRSIQREVNYIEVTRKEIIRNMLYHYLTNRAIYA